MVRGHILYCLFLSMGVPLSWESRVLTGPDSVMVRAFASEAGGAGSNPGRVIPKTLKWYQWLPCLALSIYKASTGFSSLKKDAVGVP